MPANSAKDRFHGAVRKGEEKEPKRQLYLAVPLDIYYSFFELRFIQTVVKRFQIYLIIYDPIGEVIVAWKN
ncbi:hypothetical protein myaer87_12900 [Microcystis aeruginosa NIES-87]|jgi:hypothetical protein|nr:MULTISPECIES: XisH family protein [Microcystis]MDB9414227.1 XisH family protein [Microcystis aeruginosa CS-567/02]GBE74063.1 hypothetical protein myaer87_12900 [Microcystis aeruginosa NIES-87]